MKKLHRDQALLMSIFIIILILSLVFLRFCDSKKTAKGKWFELELYNSNSKDVRKLFGDPVISDLVTNNQKLLVRRETYWFDNYSIFSADFDSNGMLIYLNAPSQIKSPKTVFDSVLEYIKQL